MSLKTDYKDEILPSGQTERTYNIVDQNGTVVQSNVRLQKAYTPQQVGDNYGATVINEGNKIINQVSGENLLVNGGFDIWSNGDKITIAYVTADLCDGWSVRTATYGDSTFEKVISSSPTTSQHSLKVTKNRDARRIAITQYFDVDVSRYVGKTLTLSGYIKSSKTTSFQTNIFGNTGSTTCLANEWTYVVFSKTITNTTGTYIEFLSTSTTTMLFDIGDTVEFDSIKLEIGEVATPFVPKSYNTEQLDCNLYPLYTQVSNPNLLINGDFQVWQRGSSVVCGDAKSYGCDRWNNRNRTQTFSMVTNTSPAPVTYACRLTKHAISSNYTGMILQQDFESSSQYAGKDVTI